MSTLPHSPSLTYYGGELDYTRWLAPEVIDPPSDLPSDRMPQSDVHSFAMTILEVSGISYSSLSGTSLI